VDETALLALCNNLLDRARSGGADHAEAAAAWQRSIDTNLENGKVHTVQTTEETVFGVRVLVGQSLGFATANGVEPDTLGEAVGEALEQARVMPADPFNGLPDPLPTSQVADLFDERVTTVDVTETTRIAAELVDSVRSRDARVRIDSGSVSAACAACALASTTGVALTEADTAMQGYLFGMAVDGDDVASFDYDGDAARNVGDFAPLVRQAARRFTEKCVSGLGAGKGRSFNGSIVLSPEAVGEFLLPNLIAAITADAVRKGRSALADKLGERIAVPTFTLIDDGTRAAGMASSAFDREGIPTSRHVLVENGMLRSFLFNHYEARAAAGDARSTGHAVGSAAALPGIGPSHLELEAGDTADTDMTAGDGPCVFVGRFSGSSNPVTGDFSGVAKNGFLVENGDRRPIKETLIAGNLFEMLDRISAVSAERRLLGGTQLLPSLRVDGISVTAG